MADYVVTTQIRLEVEARDETEAKLMAMEDIGDFMRHNSFADLMKVQEKGKKRNRFLFWTSK